MRIVQEAVDYFNLFAIDILARMGILMPCEQQIQQVETYLRITYDSKH